MKKFNENLYIRVIMNPKKKKKSSVLYFVVMRKDKISLKYYECLGFLDQKIKTRQVCINTERLGFWLNRGAKLSSKVYFILGSLGQYNYLLKKEILYDKQ